MTVTFAPTVTDDLAGMIRQYVAENDIDPDRVYMSGCSMGALGTWAMLRDYGQMFASAMPISGNADSEMCMVSVEEVPITIPLMMVVGGRDQSQMQEGMAKFAIEFEALGGTVRFETEEEYNHRDSCEKSMTAERIGWMIQYALQH